MIEPQVGEGSNRRAPLTRDDVMLASEVAELLRLPDSTVYDYARRDILPAHRVGRHWRFIRAEIEDWLRRSYAGGATT